MNEIEEGKISSQHYIDISKSKITECSCEKCQSMCHAPCCGSVEDFEKLIESGYADRLMYDDIDDISNSGKMLKPALKGYEGKKTPWETSSKKGCTFWKKGKCELHNLGLKPIQGKLAIHNGNDGIYSNEYAALSKKDWESPRGISLIEKWKKLVNYN